jgi:hypothetical protein
MQHDAELLHRIRVLEERSEPTYRPPRTGLAYFKLLLALGVVVLIGFYIYSNRFALLSRLRPPDFTPTETQPTNGY